MPSTYSASLRTEDIGNGEQTGTWGDTTDRNIGTLLEQAIAGYVAVAFASDADDTLTALNGTSDEARNMVVEVTGALTATRNMVCPTAEKLYFFYNNTSGSQSVVLKTSGGTGITVPNGKKRVLYCDGTNVLDAVTDLASGTTINNVTITTNSGSVTLTNKTIDNTNTVTLKDTLFTLQDDGDTTKQLRLQLSGLATANTGVLTLPSFTANAATMATLDAAQTVQNKTFDNTTTFETKDTLFTLQDNTTASKKALFECSGLTGTNTFTFPADGTSTLLTDLRQQSSPANYATAGGTADALTGTYTPAPTALINGQEFRLRAASANATGTPTFTPNSGTIAAKIIVKDNNIPLYAGEITGSGHELTLRYNSTTDHWHIVSHTVMVPWPLGWISGLQLSRATATTFGIAAGVSTNEDSGTKFNLTLASAFTKSLSAWAVGSTFGSLDTGAVANTTWYHVHLIRKTTDGSTDVLLSLSATAPTMPGGYTGRRRIGSILTNGSAQIVAFSQNGDEFLWDAAVVDIDDVAPGTVAITRTLASVPTGVKVLARITSGTFAGSTNLTMVVSSLDVSDQAAQVIGTGALTGFSTMGGAESGVGGWNFETSEVRTNTSAQIRTRNSTSGAADRAGIITRGWIDQRGKN